MYFYKNGLESYIVSENKSVITNNKTLLIIIEYNKKFHVKFNTENNLEVSGTCNDVINFIKKYLDKHYLIYIENRDTKYFYMQYLLSNTWRNKRELVLIRDNYTCQKCSSNNKLAVHHKTYKNRYNEKLSDLITLCNTCHNNEHVYNY